MAKKYYKKKRRRLTLRGLIYCLVFLLVAAAGIYITINPPYMKDADSFEPFDIESVPPFSGEPYFTVNNNFAYFTEEEISREYCASYSPRDSAGRCDAATACLHWKNMHEEPRGEIGMVRPSGWHTVRYDELIEDKYLYNRCHLIAFMFTGENANPDNLITGTRFLNNSGMLPFENQVAAYLRESGNHVMYRVTPIFVGRELLARGVLMEAYSVEDEGRGLQFNVFIYNAQPGIEIDYMTGDSWVK